MSDLQLQATGGGSGAIFTFLAIVCGVVIAVLINVLTRPGRDGESRPWIGLSVGILVFALMQTYFTINNDHESSVTDSRPTSAATHISSREPSNATNSSTSQPDQDSRTPSAEESTTDSSPNFDPPSAFVGTWEGRMTQGTGGAVYAYPVQLRFKKRSNGEGVGGSSKYSKQGCSGDLTVFSQSRDTIRVREEITLDPDNNCATIVFFRISVEGNKMSLVWSWDDESAGEGRANLRKTS